MPDLFLDEGNGDIKAFDGQKSKLFFRHALAEIAERDWKFACGRNRQPPQGFIAVEGKYFVYGHKARNHIMIAQPKGAARYKEEYYGVLAMAALGEVFDNSHHTINLYASHAPRDVAYAGKIRDAMRGRWNFVNHKGEYNINIKMVETIDEPVGGFCHFMMTKNGTILKNNPYVNNTILVVDAGSHTVDVVAVDPNGIIDETTLASTQAGTGDAFQSFENALRDMYPDEFQDVEHIFPERLEAAINNGFYQYGKRKLPCKEIGQQIRNALVNDIRQVIYSAGTIANYDVILLTGGGSAFIYDELRKAETDITFLLAEPKREEMRYANVYGSAKQFKLLKRLGVLDEPV